MMKSRLEIWTVRQLIDYQRDKTLTLNWEYQRGAVWDEKAARLFIDSVMRGYRIPLFYLREKPQGGGLVLEIIDGQQRINSLYGFHCGRFVRGERPEKEFPPLLDPADENEQSMFSPSLRKRECPWAGKSYEDIGKNKKLSSQFNDKELAVAIIECTDDEARHLFIRLQRGVSLSDQQKRDAWPGNFGKLVVDFGGKEEGVRGQAGGLGHPFFREVMGLKPAKDKKGHMRKTAAQLLMLFLHRASSSSPGAFLPVTSPEIDMFYRAHIGMDLKSRHVKRFRQVLDKLTKLFGGATPSMRLHQAIHLVLFADMLVTDFTQTWEPHIVSAYKNFWVNAQKKPPEGDFEIYRRLVLRGAGTAEAIRRRHEVFVRQMLSLLDNKVQRKDPKRGFTPREREAIYYRDGGVCQKCKKSVKWDDIHIHHKKKHSQGGPTTLNNGALMHEWCHREEHS